MVSSRRSTHRGPTATDPEPPTAPAALPDLPGDEETMVVTGVTHWHGHDRDFHRAADHSNQLFDHWHDEDRRPVEEGWFPPGSVAYEFVGGDDPLTHRHHGGQPRGHPDGQFLHDHDPVGGHLVFLTPPAPTVPSPLSARSWADLDPLANTPGPAPDPTPEPPPVAEDSPPLPTRTPGAAMAAYDSTGHHPTPPLLDLAIPSAPDLGLVQDDAAEEMMATAIGRLVPSAQEEYALRHRQELTRALKIGALAGRLVVVLQTGELGLEKDIRDLCRTARSMAASRGFDD